VNNSTNRAQPLTSASGSKGRMTGFRSLYLLFDARFFATEMFTTANLTFSSDGMNDTRSRVRANFEER